MKSATLLIALALFCAPHPARGEDAFQGAPQRASAAHPALYSFADLYRLALAAPAAGYTVAPAGEAPMRAALAAPAAQFSITEVPEAPLGLLLLSGVAAAIWVARRRLGYAF